MIWLSEGGMKREGGNREDREERNEREVKDGAETKEEGIIYKLESAREGRSKRESDLHD